MAINQSTGSSLKKLNKHLSDIALQGALVASLNEVPCLVLHLPSKAHCKTKG